MRCGLEFDFLDVVVACGRDAVREARRRLRGRVGVVIVARTSTGRTVVHAATDVHALSSER